MKSPSGFEQRIPTFAILRPNHWDSALTNQYTTALDRSCFLKFSPIKGMAATSIINTKRHKAKQHFLRKQTMRKYATEKLKFLD